MASEPSRSPRGWAATQRSAMRSSMPKAPPQNSSTASGEDAAHRRDTGRIRLTGHSTSAGNSPARVRNTLDGATRQDMQLLCLLGESPLQCACSEGAHRRVVLLACGAPDDDMVAAGSSWAFWQYDLQHPDPFICASSQTHDVGATRCVHNRSQILIQAPESESMETMFSMSLSQAHG